MSLKRVVFLTLITYCAVRPAFGDTMITCESEKLVPTTVSVMFHTNGQPNIPNLHSYRTTSTTYEWDSLVEDRYKDDGWGKGLTVYIDRTTGVGTFRFYRRYTEDMRKKEYTWYTPIQVICKKGNPEPIL